VPLLDRLTDGLIALFGLEFDFDLDLTSESFSPINPFLSVGVRPTTSDLGPLEAAGVTHVVSCLESHEHAKVAFLQRHFQTLFLPARDGMTQDLSHAFPRFFDFADKAHDGRLLVHCQAGVSRSGTLATAWVMRTQQLSFFEAVTTVRKRRPRVLPNIGFASQLQRLEHELTQGARTAGVSSLARYLKEICAVPVELEVIQDMLEHHDYDAPTALRAIFGNEIPRVVQGARL